MGTISQNFCIWFGGTGDWADGADWQDPPGTTANLTPATGDTLTIAAGDVAISAADATNFGTIDGQTIYLGSAQISGMPTLDTTDETLGSGILIDETGDTLDAAWTARGATDFLGTVNITGINGELVLSAVPDAASNAGVFMIDYSGLMKVGGEGALDFMSGAMNVLGDLVIQGEATFEAGTSLSAPTGPSASLDAPGVLPADGRRCADDQWLGNRLHHLRRQRCDVADRRSRRFPRRRRRVRRERHDRAFRPCRQRLRLRSDDANPHVEG